VQRPSRPFPTKGWCSHIPGLALAGRNFALGAPVGRSRKSKFGVLGENPKAARDRNRSALPCSGARFQRARITPPRTAPLALPPEPAPTMSENVDPFLRHLAPVRRCRRSFGSRRSVNASSVYPSSMIAASISRPSGSKPEDLQGFFGPTRFPPLLASDERRRASSPRPRLRILKRGPRATMGPFRLPRARQSTPKFPAIGERRRGISVDMPGGPSEA